MIISSKSLKQTETIAAHFAATLKGGETVLLIGDLGAGKTAFTKALAKAIGINDTITSPTFTIFNEYRGGKFPLYHFDMYRLENVEEAVNAGLSEFIFDRGAVKVIEWPEKIDGLLNLSDCIIIKITYSGNGRAFEIAGGDYEHITD